MKFRRYQNSFVAILTFSDKQNHPEINELVLNSPKNGSFLKCLKNELKMVLRAIILKIDLRFESAC